MNKVSIVIPFYEHVEWLMEAVESVLSQDYLNKEVIVINDGSKEDVTEFLATYGASIIYEKKENGGPSTARNRGIELATGKYIAFLDSDDLWLPYKLTTQVKYMEKYNAIWSYCGYSTFGVGKEKTVTVSENKCVEWQRYYQPIIATPCVMILKDYLDKNDECRFNPSLRYGQDIYMWLMLNANNCILAIPDVLVKVRIRGGNAARRAFVQLQARSNIWKCRKKNKEMLIDKFDVTLLFMLASELCTLGNAIISRCAKIIKNPHIIEFMSKVLFVVPWAMFKIDRKRNVRVKKEDV